MNREQTQLEQRSQKRRRVEAVAGKSPNEIAALLRAPRARKHADPDAGNYTRKNLFGLEYQQARERLALLGGKLEPGVHDYEAFIWTAQGVRLIFYPHRTTAGNRHIRVRASIDTNKKLLKRAIYALAENSCNFGFQTQRQWHREGVLLSIKRDNEARFAAHKEATCR